MGTRVSGAHAALLGFLLIDPAATFASGPSRSAPASCVLHRDGAGFTGGCGFMFGATPVLSLARAASLSSGPWRADTHPVSLSSGKPRIPDIPDSRVELEVHAGGNGVLRTAIGWFPVSAFAANEELAFRLDDKHAVPPGPFDFEIVKRAAAILSSAAVWNRRDNRLCQAAATTWSIYCALEKATSDVTGAASHRRHALEVVRILVDEQSGRRKYKHRLMDY